MSTHNHLEHVHQTLPVAVQIILVLPFLIGLILYFAAVMVSNRTHRRWPIYRTVCWVLGIFSAVVSVSGPLAEQAHVDFVAHMLGHLLLGMLAPLLMALAAPMTLMLRTLNVTAARRLTSLLKSRLIRFITDPFVASFMNVGALWMLYTTNIYGAMHEHILLHMFIHVHVFIAGYVFTISMIYIDPTPHRTSYVYRSIVLILALASHGILSKYIYANPPSGVSASQAEMGGMLMFYGGDAIDIVIIFILCLHWYKASRPRTSYVPSRKSVYLDFIQK